jgi:hypothetical protein
LDPSEEITLLSIFHDIGLSFFSMNLGVLFGLFTLKHSSLSLFPPHRNLPRSRIGLHVLPLQLPAHLRRCLPFCDIILKHCAYHVPPHAEGDQVEIPSAVAENFGFVYLGMTPLTGAPDRENAKIVPRYVQPVFISTIAIIVTR